MVNGREEDLFFDLLAGFARSNAGVLVPVDLDPVLRIMLAVFPGI